MERHTQRLTDKQRDRQTEGETDISSWRWLEMFSLPDAVQFFFTSRSTGLTQFTLQNNTRCCHIM